MAETSRFSLLYYIACTISDPIGYHCRYWLSSVLWLFCRKSGHAFLQQHSITLYWIVWICYILVYRVLSPPRSPPPPDHYLHDTLKYKTTPEKPFTFSACFGLPGSSLFTHTDGRGGGGGAVGTCSAPEDCFNFFSCRR